MIKESLKHWAQLSKRPTFFGLFYRVICVAFSRYLFSNSFRDSRVGGKIQKEGQKCVRPQCLIAKSAVRKTVRLSWYLVYQSKLQTFLSWRFSKMRTNCFPLFSIKVKWIFLGFGPFPWSNIRRVDWIHWNFFDTIH